MATRGSISQTCPPPNGRAQRRPAGWLTQVETRAGMSLGRTDNISLTGLLLRTRETFSPGTEMIVRFHLPPGAAGPLVESLAQVVRAKEGASMGMRFLELPDADRYRLERYLRQVDPN